MGLIKFTRVKLIAKYFVHACFIFLCFHGYSQIEQEAVFHINISQNNYSNNLIYSSSENISAVEKNYLSFADVSYQTSPKLNSSVKKQETGQTNTTRNYEKDVVKKSILSIFLKDDEITTLKRNLIDYGNNHFPIEIRSIYIAIVEKSFEYPVILLFIILILFFIINIIVVFIILNYTIRRKSYKERFEKIYSKMYEEVLMSYMFGSIDWDTALVKLKKSTKTANRKILIAVLMNFKLNFKGEMEHFIPEIYTKLDIQNDSLKLAHSAYNHKKVMGIMELTHLYPEGAKGLIKKLINDPSDYVRAEAQTAYIRLNPETPFDFFYTLEKPFTRWTQLSAFNLIRLHQLPVPSFTRFLDFSHFNIRNFSLRMITYFQQLENVPEIIRMVEAKQEMTRFLAYKAINDLRLYDSRELIKGKFENETEKNKTEIIKAFRNIGTSDDFGFLLGVMKTGSVSLKTEACRSMYFMSREGEEKVMQIDEQLVPEIKHLIAHITDPRN